MPESVAGSSQTFEYVSAPAGAQTIAGSQSPSRVFSNLINNDTAGSATTVTTTASGNSIIVVDRAGPAPTGVIITPSSSPATVTITGTNTTVQLPALASLFQSTEVIAPVTTPGASALQLINATRDVVIGDITGAIGAQVRPGDVIIQGSSLQNLTQSLDTALVTVLDTYVGTFGFNGGVIFNQFSLLMPSSGSNFNFAVSGISDGSDTVSGADSLVGANEILVNTSNSTAKELFAVNLSLTNQATVVLQGIEAAVLAAPGKVRNEGNAPILISSDFQAQSVTGGGGNDTLIGTGNDTLTGGAGNDIFGIKGAGKYTITDFNKAGDAIAFQMDGVTNLTQLKAKVTSVVSGTNSVTFNFGADTSVTLVGVTAADLTAGMIKFSFIG